MEKIDALACVRREMKRQQLSITDLAQKSSFGITSIYSIFRRKHITVEHLAHFTEALQYNFFKEIGAKYPFAEPTNEETAVLQQRIKELELEVTLLRRTIKDIMGK